MNLTCTNCFHDIDSKHANVKTDLIKCPNCGELHRLSELVERKNSSALAQLPEYELMPPMGSTIDSFSTSSSMEITIPRRKINAIDAFPIFFATIWLGFIAFWTTMAASFSIFFALFSLPFWFVGIGMASSLIKSLTESQLIELDRYQLKVTKRHLLGSSTTTIDVQDIQKISKKPVSFKNMFKGFGNMGGSANQGSGKRPVLPVIQHGVKEITILDTVSENEQDWGLKLLKGELVRLAELEV